MTIGIYSILNKINGKIYVGQSIDVETRWRNHKNELNRNNHNNSHLQSAWNKYGEQSFEFNLLEKCNDNKLDDNEIWWIDYFNSADNSKGYNFSSGGNSPMKGKHLSDEICKKISKNRTGKCKGENNYMYGRFKELHPRFNKPQSDESRLKISKSKNTSGYFRVDKKKCEKCANGFYWRYSYLDNDGFRTSISDKNISKLKEKVLAKGLEWIKF